MQDGPEKVSGETYRDKRRSENEKVDARILDVSSSGIDIRGLRVIKI